MSFSTSTVQFWRAHWHASQCPWGRVSVVSIQCKYYGMTKLICIIVTMCIFFMVQPTSLVCTVRELLPFFSPWFISRGKIEPLNCRQSFNLQPPAMPAALKWQPRHSHVRKITLQIIFKDSVESAKATTYFNNVEKKNTGKTIFRLFLLD